MHKSRSMFKENSMCSSVLGQGWTTWLRTSSVSSWWEPICSSVLYEGWTIILVHDPLVQYYTCPIVYLLLMDALLWTGSYTCYTTSCPLVHRGRPWEGAIMWNIYILVLFYIYIYIFLSPSSFSSLFFFAMCHSLIGYQSHRSMFSRWEPCVIFGLVRAASCAQVSCLYIVEFLCYPLHLQNSLLWPSSSRASSRSLCVHRLLPSKSRYLPFSLSLGFFSFSKNVWDFCFFVRR